MESPSIRNAIIMAAGTSSRFVPLSAEIPKGLIEVKGEILIERQIRQLQEAGITDITVVVGYKAEMFSYLKNKFNVGIVYNDDYKRYNNSSSVIRVLDKLGNTFLCSSDNYFLKNVFIKNSEESYYSALYAKGDTKEYCLSVDSSDHITGVTVGGKDSWFMVGHVYFSEEFSLRFKEILSKDYENESTRRGYWEDVYICHITDLPKMKIYRYGEEDIKEFDSLDELRLFDKSYWSDTRSPLLKNIAQRLNCGEEEISDFSNIPHTGEFLLFSFMKGCNIYEYNGQTKQIRML